MKKLFILSVFTINLNVCCAQTPKNTNERFIQFVRSFETNTSTDIIDFEHMIRVVSPSYRMTKEEALEFVYHSTDTTVLYCNEHDISNETEEYFGVVTDLYLPLKWQKVDMEKFVFIMYISYECQNPDDFFYSFLTLSIIDNGFNVKDSIIVSKNNGFEFELSGLLNPKNGKVFLLYKSKGKDIQDTHKTYMYEVDEKSLKFKLVKEGNISRNIYTNNLISVIEKLEWDDFF